MSELLLKRKQIIKSQVQKSKKYSKKGITLYHGNSLDLYSKWPAPTVIISDGPYGLGSYEGDPPTVEKLVEMYEPHVKSWSKSSLPETTLWFWNSELGWATVHPLLVKHGWRFVNCHIWDKGIAHAAGNSNTKTLRKFPVVSELCVQYVKVAEINGMNLKDWLRFEWERTGLSFSKSNEACGLKNAATRKYLTKDHLWYYPPPNEFEKLVKYANKFGSKEGKPYFSRNGKTSLTKKEWARMRSKFSCSIGITNVWKECPLSGEERLKDGTKRIHANQKPIKLIERAIIASSDVNDVVWDPFGGLGSSAIAAYKNSRKCVSAELNSEFYHLSVNRLKNYKLNI